MTVPATGRNVERVAFLFFVGEAKMLHRIQMGRVKISKALRQKTTSAQEAGGRRYYERYS